MVTAARSRSIWGPYEGCPHNPILTNMCDPSWQVQCAGHGDLVEDEHGNWWMAHLGIRLTRRTMTHLGRETFLTPVRWEDGWPLCGTDRKTLLLCSGPLPAPQKPQQPFEADMTRTDWELEWIFLRRPDMADHQRIPGTMLLRPSSHTLADPNPTFAALRPLDFDCITQACFTFAPCQPGDEAGMAVRLDSRSFITCTLVHPGQLVLTLHADEIHHTVAQHPAPEGPLHLRICADKERYCFDYAAEDCEFHSLGHVNARFLSTDLSGRCFTGTVIGLYALCREHTEAVTRVTEFIMHI